MFDRGSQAHRLHQISQNDVLERKIGHAAICCRPLSSGRQQQHFGKTRVSSPLGGGAVCTVNMCFHVPLVPDWERCDMVSSLLHSRGWHFKTGFRHDRLDKFTAVTLSTNHQSTTVPVSSGPITNRKPGSTTNLSQQTVKKSDWPAWNVTQKIL